MPALIAALKDEDADVRHYAAVSLAAIDNSVIDGIPVLVEGTRHEDREMRLGSVKCLAGLGANAKSAVPALVEVIDRERDDEVRMYAVLALRLIDPSSKVGVAVLCKALGHPQESLANFAAEALMKMGPDAKDAIPTLALMLKDRQQPKGQLTAATVLAGIGDPAIPTFVIALRGEDQRVRVMAARALGLIRPAAPETTAEVVAALEEAVKDENAAVRSSAVEALRRIRVGATLKDGPAPR